MYVQKTVCNVCKNITPNWYQTNRGTCFACEFVYLAEKMQTISCLTWKEQLERLYVQANNIRNIETCVLTAIRNLEDHIHDLKSA